ncbi:MAG: DUF1330 domain-containing protein [Pseudomonadota bacterium]|nr:DUF1330 domain-containing protein [Pseudomonadales bacterium]MDY6919502.1 DUF1330 domain-containing protein [Pseudomonadota bacterium]
MYTIDPSPGSFAEAVARLPADTPVVMLNLLAFREQAEYDEADSVEPCTGREAYQHYSREALHHVQAVGGQVVFMGAPQYALVAPADEHWDEVLLVRYPSIQAFVAMVKAPEYQAIARHRTAALYNARLVAMLEHPGR